MNEPADAHCPVVEMSTRSKLSCLSWNKYTKNHIASSDYEGIVTVWDVTTRQVHHDTYFFSFLFRNKCSQQTDTSGGNSGYSPAL